MSNLRGALYYLIYVAVVALIFMSVKAFGKPIDIQKISKKEGWHNEVEGSYESEKGFEDKVTISGELATQYMSGDHLGIAILEGEQEKVEGEEEGRSDLQHFRYRHFFTPKIGFEKFLQREADTDKDLQVAYAYGTGPFYRVYHDYFHNLTLGAALVSETEEYKDKDIYNNRIYAYLSGGIRLPKSLFFGATVHAEPKVTDFDNYRVYSKLSLKYKLEANIIVGFEFDRVDNTHPAPGVPESNQETKTTVGVEF